MRAPQQDWLFLLGFASLACAVGDNSSMPLPLSAGDFGDGGGDDDDDDEDANDTENDGDDDDGSQSTDGTTGSNDDGPLDDGPGDGPGSTGAMDDAGVTSMPSDDAGPDSSDAGMEDDYGYASDDGAPVGNPCAAYAANVVNCFGGDTKLYEYYCYADLEFYAAIYGPACASAWEELYACIGSVSCMQLSAGQGCDPEVSGVQASC